MKLPFSNCIGPTLKKNYRFFNRICSSKLIGYHLFVTLLGIFGVVVSVVDIVRIIQGGPILSDNLWRFKPNATNERKELERDAKLMASILGVEHYLLMCLGSITEHPALFMPYLGLEGIVILLETCTFLVRMIFEGILVSRSEIVLTGFMIHNWLQVFCLFRSLLSNCDL